MVVVISISSFGLNKQGDSEEEVVHVGTSGSYDIQGWIPWKLVLMFSDIKFKPNYLHVCIFLILQKKYSSKTEIETKSNIKACKPRIFCRLVMYDGMTK